MFIDAGFDGGNIDVVSISQGAEIALNIRKDTKSDHAQWFYFRVLGAKDQSCKFSILNAGEAAYPEAWPDGSVVASYDGADWFRIATQFDGTVLAFAHDCPSETLYVALSPPYPLARHHDLICRALASDHCDLVTCIPSVENRSVEVLRIGSHDETAPKVWIIARQHPGEPMAEWFMEGLIDRLIDSSDQVSADLRAKATFYLVTNMNPDGSSAGNLRTNAAGVDLNRAWATPNSSPEVGGVLNLMDTTGVDLFLDIHGDEEFRFAFAAGCEGNPNFTPQMAQADAAFRQAMHAANADFSVRNGYPLDAPCAANLSVACNQVGERFGCLSLTIEMPFKDNADRPDPRAGWGTQHSVKLGHSTLDAITQFLS
jgi:murein tripeptide amidase MpaA